VTLSVAVPAPVTKVAVPSGLVGATQSQAQSILQGKGLTSTVVYRTSTSVSKDVVISTNPSSGSKVAEGASVTLTVSSGVANVPVPSLIGLTQNQAYTLLQQAGLTVGNVTSQTSPTVPANVIISSTPTAGTPVPPGSSVSIVVSQGAPPPTTTTTTSPPSTTSTTSTPSSSTTTTSSVP
jgi:eukaryotic-like serine/threonine-protein kinase